MKNLKLSFVALALSLAHISSAQWLTQSFNLKAGWNAVYTHVDASYDTLDALVATNPANPILEVWRWNQPSAEQLTASPLDPLAGVSEWSSWVRNETHGDIVRMVANTAYLVRVATNAPTYTWTLKGVPKPPVNEWTISGLNFIGFPTLASSPPNFEKFLFLSPELKTNGTQVFYYNGGELNTNNPASLPGALWRGTLVNRGQAYWVRSGTLFNTYFGPFQVDLDGANAVDFNDGSGIRTVRLKNQTTNNVTVRLQLLASETPPVGYSNIVSVPPLLVRGALNFTNLAYAFTNLTTNTMLSWTLAPRGQTGSEYEVVLGLNRYAITADPGSLLGGVLRFTDTVGTNAFTQIDVPVSAEATGSGGLWVGNASVDTVQQYLKAYKKNATNDSLAVSTNGNYIVTNIDTSMTSVPSAMPLRLIVHNPDSGNARLLQHVFYGLDGATNPIVSTGQSALNPAFLKNARRISAVHLPWTTNNATWQFSGRLTQGAAISAALTNGYNETASNPFMHEYHPDHDNLDATFKTVLAQGSESYTIERTVSLSVVPPGNDFNSLVDSGVTLNGNYSEVIALKGLARAGGAVDTRTYNVSGTFTLKRISSISTLTLAP